MRVHLSAQFAESSRPPLDRALVVLTIRPAYGLPGQTEYRTTTPELLKLLRRRTELSETLLERFQEKIMKSQTARLNHIQVSEELLEHVGFFID